jgi:hypothetical protein
MTALPFTPFARLSTIMGEMELVAWLDAKLAAHEHTEAAATVQLGFYNLVLEWLIERHYQARFPVLTAKVNAGIAAYWAAMEVYWAAHPDPVYECPSCQAEALVVSQRDGGEVAICSACGFTTF